MGSGGSWSSDEWATYSKSVSVKSSINEIYRSKRMDSYLDPKLISIRESRDSEANPNSTAVMVGFDVTGSMSKILNSIARQGLGVLVQEIHNRKPISDPHIMLAAIGDIETDKAPLQVTQYEAQVGPITSQLEKFWLERGGGHNRYESYPMLWLFASLYTSLDCFEKRGKKGYIFTSGDENPAKILRRDDINRFLKEPVKEDLSIEQLLDMADKTYEVFHIIIEEGNHSGVPLETVVENWTDLLGQRAIRLSDHTKLAEVIVSTIEINEGRTSEDVIKSWSGDTSLVVSKAIKGLVKTGASATGVVRFAA